jgi:sec-independent protein translocase protein TatA
MIEGLFRPMHLVIVLAVALFVFGPKKLPDSGKGIAEGIRNFKSGLKESDSESSCSSCVATSGSFSAPRGNIGPA